MDLDYTSTLLTFGSTVLIFVASGIVPIINAELNIVLLASVAPRHLLPTLFVVATLSHMIGKSVMYLGGRGIDRWRYEPLKRRVAAARAKLEGRSELGAVLIFVSAVTGIPPFYAVTVVSGVMRYRFVPFFILGFVGRLLRFGGLLFVPAVARVLMPG